MKPDAFEEFSEATKLPNNPVQRPKPEAPHLPSPDSPDAIPEENSQINEKKQEKIRIEPKIIEKPIYKEKIIETPVYKNKITAKEFDLSGPLKITAYGAILLLLLLLGKWVVGQDFSQHKLIKTIQEPKVKTVYKNKVTKKIIYRDKIKWKIKTVFKDKIIYKTDHTKILNLQNQNKELRHRLNSLDKHLELHKMAIRKFFEDPKRYKIKLQTMVNRY